MFHLGNVKSKNADNILFSYLNINSTRNKFENLCELVAGNAGILLLRKQNWAPRSRIRNS